MKFYLICLVVFVSSNRACQISFDHLDTLNIIRQGYERDIFNLTGELQYCPKSLVPHNISIRNPILKRLSILNVSYLLETHRFNVTVLARLIGFSPLTIQFYFHDGIDKRITPSTEINATEQQKLCSQTSNHQQEILDNCPTLSFEDNQYILSQTVNVAIKRHQTIIDILFMSVVFFLVTMGTLCIGCQLEINQLLNNFRRPIPLIVGLFCQIVYLPSLSYGIVKIFKLDNSTSLGLLSTASTPGGGSSNIYTALLAGDVDLSVTMTFLSTIVSFGTFPFWVWLLGKDYIDFGKAKFPWWNMFLSVTTLFLPAMTGLILRRYRPVLAHRIARYLNPIAVGYLVFILTFGVYINMYIFYIIDYKSIMACCFLPWFGFIGGAIVSLVGIGDKKKTIAICIETGIQNTAVAIFFLRLTFPAPEADIALANPILVSMAIPIPFLMLVLTRTLVKRCQCCAKLLPIKSIQEEAAENEQKPEKALIEELLEEKQEQNEFARL